MELRRYQKTRDRLGHFKKEACDSSEFVAFWADCKYVCARDRSGVEWMLAGGTTLQSIEQGVEGLTRIHHACLVRTDLIEGQRRVEPDGQHYGYWMFLVAGHEYRASRRHWRQWCRRRFNTVQAYKRAA